MINYFFDSYQILNKVYSEGAYLKQAIASTVIEEKNRSFVIKTCYGVLEKDIELNYYIKALCGKNPKLNVRTILKIGFYDIKHLGKKPYAVIDNAVELAKKLGKTGTSGFINAVLRKFSTEEIPLPTEKIENMSIKYSYPEFAVKMLIRDYGEIKAESIMKEREERTCLAFYTENGEEYLNKINVEFEKTPYDNVFFAKNFVRNDDFDKGVYTYQNIGSTAICDAVDGGETLLDACAAPGGKSVNLSRKFKFVTSLELREHRTELIKSYVTRMGVTNITAITEDATIYNEKYEKAFDVALVDAPCSGFGVLKENPDIALLKDENNISELKLLQAKILSNVSNYVKVGGYLYFSTCSVFKTENINNVKRFLKLNENYEICPLTSKIPSVIEDGTLQFLPDISYGSGFFVAKLMRKG